MRNLTLAIGQVLVFFVSTSIPAAQSQFGTEKEARAMLEKAVAAVKANKDKALEMFNKGELAIFRRVGLTPVLFGEALIGSRLPNLTYLLVFDDDAARQAAWNTFREDAEWKTLRAIPEYEDKRIVSRITNVLLSPAEYSQI